MASDQERKTIVPFLTEPEQFEYVHANEEVTILKKNDMEDLAMLFAVLYVKKWVLKQVR
jgi:hypothetical protein